MDFLKDEARKHSAQTEAFRVSYTFSGRPKDIWPSLVNHRGMVDWFPGISDVQVEANSEGKEELGCKRTCQFGSETLYEEIVLWEAPQVFGYKIEDNDLIEDHVAFVTLEYLGDEKTLVRWIQYFRPKGNALKRFLLKNVMLPRAIHKGLRNLEKRIAA